MIETDQSQTRMLEENLAYSANAPKPQVVPFIAACVFFIRKNSGKIQYCNQAELQWNASFLDIHSFIEI